MLINVYFVLSSGNGTHVAASWVGKNHYYVNIARPLSRDRVIWGMFVNAAKLMK
jgi:hypothetical protein